jgi:dipeptidyl aminopeptidase/acylaminoacyl peptidase
MESRPYALPGDKFSKSEPNIFDVASRKQLKPEVDRFEHEWLTPRLQWNRDGSRFMYQQVDRGHQRLRVIEVDTRSGATRNIIDEKSDTFIWTAHTEALRLQLVNWLEKSEEIIYVSEQDGWRHLYLVEPKDAKLRQITKGEWVVRGIERIDEEARQVWFSAGGKNPDQDPYFVQHYRVNFDGSGFVALTDGNGNHTIQFSPDRKFIVDTYSRPDAPPVHELRRTSDGKFVCKLEEADITEWKAKGGTTPEVFVAKGRDSRTDIWGLIHRPKDYDPNKKYPVVESIYAGPQGSFVPKSFGGGGRFSALTDLGFIVVQIDGMGTANRSKAFHDTCWHNLKDGGFADRILWMKAAAEKHPEMDITRVGVYGNSAGGQNAAAAVLFHPEFYKAAVASCGCHDNRLDKASWNEQWMGYPVGPQYAASSNVDNAYRLRGKLLLIVGEMDNNVPPESTLRVVDALIRAGKDFDMLMVPNAGHGMGGLYGSRRMRDFFVRHLQKIEPPDRNSPRLGAE